MSSRICAAHAIDRLFSRRSVRALRTSGWRIDCLESFTLSRVAIDVTAARRDTSSDIRRRGRSAGLLASPTFAFSLVPGVEERGRSLPSLTSSRLACRRGPCALPSGAPHHCESEGEALTGVDAPGSRGRLRGTSMAPRRTELREPHPCGMAPHRSFWDRTCASSASITARPARVCGLRTYKTPIGEAGACAEAVAFGLFAIGSVPSPLSDYRIALHLRPTLHPRWPRAPSAYAARARLPVR